MDAFLNSYLNFLFDAAIVVVATVFVVAVVRNLLDW